MRRTWASTRARRSPRSTSLLTARSPGKILKIKVDVKEMGAGVKAEAAKANAEAAKKLDAAK